MTPEREAEIRDRLKHSEYDWYTEPLVEDLLAALDAERAAVTHLKRELVAERAERDELRGRVERFKTGLHSLSSRSLAPDRLADDIPDDPDEVSTYVLGRVGGMGCACGLWAKRDFPEFFATEGRNDPRA